MIIEQIDEYQNLINYTESTGLQILITDAILIGQTNHLLIYWLIGFQDSLIFTLIMIILAAMSESDANAKSENQAYSLLHKYIPQYLNQLDQQHLELDIYGVSNLIWQSIASKVDPSLSSQTINTTKILKSFEQIEKSVYPQKAMAKKQNILLKNLRKNLQSIKQQFKAVINTEVKQYEQQQCARQALLRGEFEEKIIMIDYEIFTQTLIGICPSVNTVQTDRWDLFDLIFQHPYPRKTLSEDQAKNIMGPSLFQQKTKRYKQLRKKNWVLNQNIIVCHGCLQPPSDFQQLFVCAGECANSDVTPCLSTDPYLYNRKHINGLSSLIKKDSQTLTSQSSYLYPYLIYYKNEQRQPCCGRVFCEKCQQMIGINKPQDPEQNNCCPYCSGQCSCFRCNKVDTLTKMLAYYKQNGGNLEQIIKKLLFNLIEKEDKLKYSKQQKKILSKVPIQQFKKWIKVLKRQLGYLAFEGDHRKDKNTPDRKTIKYYPKIRDLFSLSNQKRLEIVQNRNRMKARKLKRACQRQQQRRRQAEKEKEENSEQKDNQYISSSDEQRIAFDRELLS